MASIRHRSHNKCYVLGILNNTNTLESFHAIDKQSLLKEEAMTIWEDIHSGFELLSSRAPGISSRSSGCEGEGCLTVSLSTQGTVPLDFFQGKELLVTEEKYAKQMGFGASKTQCRRSKVTMEWVEAKRIATGVKHNITSLHAIGVKTSKIFAALAKKYRGYENIGFMEKDMRNLFDKECRLALEPGDANAMLELFTSMQEVDPNFIYAMKLDEEHRLKNVFWVDSKG
ncbi:hypothetical protein LWI29_036561 [Acer saccharum]|uniref:Ubiquitin-like modifier-activating enzyme Atg7 N-terminal domain-containing protein n=1 Tax=Acer saccharum TaxID=4024 RepID=A0AA39RP50_ACESA|nr:hypothetical protein LWI29_036561 [Acer saccharum]